MQKYADNELSRYNISKDVPEVKNIVKDKIAGVHIARSDFFKTLREPIIKQQKETDKKQDKVINQLKENQRA